MPVFCYICCTRTTNYHRTTMKNNYRSPQRTAFWMVVRTLLIVVALGAVAWWLITDINNGREQKNSTNKIEVVSDTPEGRIITGVESIKSNTTFDFETNGWSLHSIMMLLLTLFTLIFTIINFSAQFQVEKQTKNASVPAQIGALEDLLRHLYRNSICTGAILYNFKKQKITEKAPKSHKKKASESYERYPSEANMLKLQTAPETYVLTIDVIDDDVYKKMSELRKLLQNYNCEIEIARRHQTGCQFSSIQATLFI